MGQIERWASCWKRWKYHLKRGCFPSALAKKDNVPESSLFQFFWMCDLNWKKNTSASLPGATFKALLCTCSLSFPAFSAPSLKWKIKPPVKAGDMFRPVTHTDPGRLQSGNSWGLITFCYRWWIYVPSPQLCSDFCIVSLEQTIQWSVFRLMSYTPFTLTNFRGSLWISTETKLIAL